MMKNPGEQAEEKYRMLFDNAPGAIFIADSDGSYTEVNEAACRMTGYSRDELLNMTVFELASPDSPPEVFETFAVLKNSGKMHGEILIRRKDGSDIDVFIDAVALSGRRLMAFCSDITERKKAEEEIKAKNVFLERLIQQSPLPIFVLDNKGILLVVNDAFLKFYAVPNKDMILGLNALTMPDNIKYGIDKHIREALKGNEVDVPETEFISPYDNKKLFTKGKMFPIFTPEGKLTNVVVIQEDVTKRKEAQEALRKNEAKQTAMISNISDVIAIMDEHGVIQYKSPNIEKRFGWKPEDLVGLMGWETVHPDDLERISKEFYQLLQEDGRTTTVEYQYKCKDGSYRLIHLTAMNLVHDPDVEGVLLNYHDITDRNEAEEALRKSEERYRLIDDASLDLIYSYDRNGRFTHANRSLCQALGTTADQILGKTHAELGFPDEQCQEWDELYRRVYESGSTVSAETSTPMPGGETRYYVVVLNPLHDNGGSIIGIAGTTRDITQFKKAEEALRESREKFRQMVERSSDVFYRQNIKTGEYDYVSPKVFTLLGHKPEELMDMGLEEQKEQIHPDDLPGLLDFSNALIEADNRGERYIEREFRLKNRSGEYLWIRGNYTLIRDGDGEPQLIIGSLQDITPRKQAQEALRKEKEYYHSFVESLNEWVWEMDLKGIHTYSNPAVEDILGYRAEEMVGSSTTKFWFEGADSPEMLEWFEETLASGKGWKNFESAFRHKNGSRVFVETTAIPIYDSQNMLIGYRGIDRDITRRKEAQEALRKSEAKQTAMISNISDVIAIMDEHGVIQYKSPNIEKRFGWKPEDLVGLMGWETVHPDDLERISKEFYQLLQEDGRTTTVEYQYKCKDGSYRLIHLAAMNLVHDPDVEGVLLNYHDITDRKEAEEALRESEERYRLIDDASLDFVYSYDRNGRFTHANRSLCQALGTTADQILGKTHAELGFPDEQCQEWDELYRRVYESGSTVSAETSTPMPGGETRYYELVLNPLHDRGGSIIGIAGTTRDITQFKQAEEALRESEEKFRQMVERSSDVFYRQNIKTGKYDYVSPKVLTLLGHKPEELMDMGLEEQKKQIHPDDLPGLLDFSTALIEADKRGERYIEREFRLKNRSGSYLWIRGNYTLIRDDDGDPQLVIGSLQDITERKLIEEDLRESESRFRKLSNLTFEGILIHDKGVAIDVNESLTRIFGYTQEEMIGKNLVGLLIPPEYHATIKENIVKSSAKPYEVMARKKDGTLIPIELEARDIKDKDGQFRVAAIRDITQRKLAESELKMERDKLTAIFESMVDGVYIAGKDYDIQYINPALLREFGSPEGKTCHKYLHDLDEPCPFCRSEEVFAGKTVCWEWTSPKNGKSYDLIATPMINSDGSVSKLEIFRDITERKRLEKERRSMEARLHQSQKLESLATLAGGAAHEINNPLQGILSYATLIQDGVDETELKEFTEEIKTESLRIATIIKSLLSFARVEKQSYSPACIRDIVYPPLDLLGPMFRKHQITVETNISEELPPIRCQSQQIEQVLIDLLTNARDALNKKYKGWHKNKKIRISAKSFQKDGVEWVRTTVEDHGTGISEEIIGRIFDPFFTTKERGKGPTSSVSPPGTGLGLSVSHGIITDHHGRLWVESLEGEYTRFHIDLRVDNGWSVKGVEKVIDDQDLGEREQGVPHEDESRGEGESKTQNSSGETATSPRRRTNE